MDIQRRLLLKGIVLSGVSGCLGWANPSVALAAATNRAQSAKFFNPETTLLLVNGETEHSAFLQGAWIAGGANMEVHDINIERDFLLLLQRRIKEMSTEGCVITGLVDDASGTLIIDLARSTGACMRWLGQHTVEPEQSRHLLYSSRVAGDQGGLFGHQLALRGFSCIHGSHRKREEQVLEPILYTREGVREDAQWSTDLGFALTGDDLVDFSEAPQINSGSVAPLNGHFVSFAFKIQGVSI
ncbi:MULTISPECIES: hypothetical protein [Nitrosomonas]|uniref:Uncharacterized protein n=2 Tax=Nitrosomonas eutropha TaxID=916 RepID=A0ABX5MBF5_9PROT|nr:MULTISPECIES: hypothetical protein [Nitrosomonas]ABI59899.1 conserved hypothetical protein [Nitrosomonas eutropha C91]MXS80398.1 hypothetical protein [Nitrosomonas sp. GH22]PXV80097.1 hypothetical protein C8R14_11912 [Nitrosomonas eutropha]SCX21316.1 hypothetical protein SAMN05216379_11629 [Nitrosomonas eutropha]SDW77586.1 hypothetical protein SAMN05216317_11243 [Nitrosomonas eutropha]